MTLPRKLLVATDFSDCARIAEDAAIAWAKRSGGELHWIHALEVPLPVFEPYAVAVPEATIGAARDMAVQKLGEAAKRAEAAGVSGTTHLGEVPAAYSVADRAKELSADLVVIGTHGHAGLRRAVLGSVAEKVVKLAPCSVLTVKGDKAAPPPRKIIVGVDFADDGHSAVKAAAALAADLGASLRLVHALELRIPFVTPYEVTIPDGVIEAAQEEAKRRLAEIAAELDASIPTTCNVRSSPPHLALSEAAQEDDTDLIVTGSRGLTGIKHALLGSVAERTVRTAPCSVWTVRTT